MMATEYTPNYNLDLYASADKPNLRDQYNAAMGKIDTQMKANADGITNANANVGTLQTQMQQVQGDVTALESTVETHGTQMQQLESTVETHGTQIAAVQKTANNALSLAQANESEIADTQSDVASLTSRVTTVEGTANKNKTDVASLDTRMGVAERNITEAQNDISDLQTEKAPTNHASTANTYGQGSSTNFGHLKVVDSGTAAASTGTAASPKMVNDAVNVAPTVLAKEDVNIDGVDGTFEVSVILNEIANMIVISVGKMAITTTGPIDTEKNLVYKLPEKYRPTRDLRAALFVTTSTIVTLSMNTHIGTDGTISIILGSPKTVIPAHTVGGNTSFVYGLS